MAKQTNKKYVRDTIPFLKEAVQRTYKRMESINWKRVNRIEETTRLICVNSHTFKSFDMAYRYARLLELQLETKRREWQKEYNLNNIVEEEFNKIICFPISFEDLKKHLFLGKRKQTIQGKTYQNIDDALSILIGIGGNLERYYTEKKNESITLFSIFEHTAFFIEYILDEQNKYPNNNYLINLLKRQGEIYKKSTIPPTLYLFTIVAFLNYWDKFCKKK